MILFIRLIHALHLNRVNYNYFLLCYLDSHANCEVGGENKYTGGDMEVSGLSNNESDDSDMDKQ